MTDATIKPLVFLVLAAHIAVGIAVPSRRTARPLLPLLNLVMALAVIAYWVPRWYSYVARGITWYATDQLVPAYAILVCLLSGLALSGRYRGMVPHWLVFGLDAAVLVAFAAFILSGPFKRMF